ncbi:hypothetical protein, partial [Pseudomonas allii]|uniref:hypothetical protein n=1 Tax=Pseudomonas allii TaxID=2740531 RepID=UPI00196371D4
WLAVNQALANQPDAVVTLLGPLRGPNAGQARSPQGTHRLFYLKTLKTKRRILPERMRRF